MYESKRMEFGYQTAEQRDRGVNTVARKGNQNPLLCFRIWPSSNTASFHPNNRQHIRRYRNLILAGSMTESLRPVQPPTRDVSHLELPWSLESQEEMFLHLRKGDIVTFTLDPVNSMTSLLDPILDEPLAAFPARRHLGLIGGKHSTVIAGVPFFFVEIFVISHQKPDTDRKIGEQTNFCIPIYPTADHFERRPPLHPSSPLTSHQKLFLHTSVKYHLRLGQVDGEDATCPYLGSDEMEQVAYTYLADQRNRANTVEAFKYREMMMGEDLGSQASSEGFDQGTSPVKLLDWEMEMRLVSDHLEFLPESWWQKATPVIREFADEHPTFNPIDAGGPREWQPVVSVSRVPKRIGEVIHGPPFFQELRLLDK